MYLHLQVREGCEQQAEAGARAHPTPRWPHICWLGCLPRDPLLQTLLAAPLLQAALTVSWGLVMLPTTDWLGVDT